MLKNIFLFCIIRCIRCLKWKECDDMSKFNIKNRRYLGSKTRLMPFIKSVIDENCKDIKVFADIFAGTGNVAWSFNEKNISVIVNDILESNYLSYVAFFGPQIIDNSKIKRIISEYNNLEVEKDNYFSINFKNTYYSEENSKKIGFIREDIETKYENKTINERERAILITSLIYAMDSIANTVGHYDAYRLKGDLNKELILKELELPQKGFNNKNLIYKEDANLLVNKIKADLVYIDPPYNSRQYSDAYHLLENVATWRKPKVYGVAKKMDRTHIKSKYSTVSAPMEFEDLIKNIDAKYILVSYNNMGNKGASRSQAKISDEVIINTLSEKGKVKIFETDFNQFTTGKTKVNNHKERLFLCEVGKKGKNEKAVTTIEGFVKSPLNYTGGKHKLLPQLFEKFPSKIETFVDLFGGGFNVGANIEANTIIYNDNQKEVVRLIKLLNKYSHRVISNRIENNIKKYNLSNTIEYGYDYYGCNSNSGVGKYNRKNYYKMRDDYNKIKTFNENKDFLLLTLIIFSFNNQIRFNNNGDFNMPVGKRDFNSSTRKNLKEFSSMLKNKNVEIYNKDFSKIDLTKYEEPFVYCDPPYILGMAAYNENNGWNIKYERRLLNYLKELNEKGISFALSNVLEHKGQIHEELKQWAEENYFNIIYIKSNYNNSNYQKKNKKDVTREVLITNY